MTSPDDRPVQPGLFDPPPRPSVGRHASEQAKQIARVEGMIAQTVEAFCRLRAGQEFHLAELNEYVSARTQVAPDSPRRILGLLRRSGQVRVVLVSRSESRYRVAAEW